MWVLVARLRNVYLKVWVLTVTRWFFDFKFDEVRRTACVLYVIQASSSPCRSVHGQ